MALDIRGAWCGEAWDAWLIESRNVLCCEESRAHRSRHPRAGSLQVLSHATVEVARHNLRVLPYHVEKSHSGPAPEGCPSELNSGVAPVIVAQVT
jgi:hypothetical protein